VQQGEIEALTISAADTYEHPNEPQATLNSTSTTNTLHMPGGRSHGDLATTENLTNNNIGPLDPIGTALKPLTDDLPRPSLATGQNHQSISSISQLHVPGEFPRTNVETVQTLGADEQAV
jgi:hypothetical protein